MLFEPWDYVFDVEDCACWGAYRMFERLERKGAVGEGKTLECSFAFTCDYAAGSSMLTNLP